MLTFFVISFLTNILGPIIPDIIRDFDLNLGFAGFLPFAFFLSYGVMSIPAGVLVEKYNEKVAMAGAFFISSLGALLFAMHPTFPIAMLSLFIIGLGMAVLQVAINPLLRVSGGEEHFAFNSVLAQLFFGLASFISPLIYSYLVNNLNDVHANYSGIMKFLAVNTPNTMPWVSLYWVFAVTSILMVIVLLLSKFPVVERAEDEKAEGWKTYKKLLKDKQVIIFFGGIFLYVGAEQGVANWMSQFLYTYHNYDPQTEGAQAISLFWGLLTAGSFLGLILLKFIGSRTVLKMFTAATIVALFLALFGSAEISYYAFPAIGFTISVMWSIIISLALNSVKSHHGAFSGILVTGIVGGAIVPLIVGWLSEFLGLRVGMLIIFIALAYIYWIGVWARPLIDNKRVGSN